MKIFLQIKDLLPLGWQRRMMIADNVIEGLRYLHTRPKPIVHRDIKTSNILLDEADGAKVRNNNSIKMFSKDVRNRANQFVCFRLAILVWFAKKKSL